jgi:hypothetical protein
MFDLEFEEGAHICPTLKVDAIGIKGGFYSPKRSIEAVFAFILRLMPFMIV